MKRRPRLPVGYRRLLHVWAWVLILTPGLAHASAAALQLTGRGAQIYVCTGAVWKLRGPDATLLDSSGRVVGRHYDGPTWEAADGSRVVGEVVVHDAAPAKGAADWLVLRAKQHAGAGLFAGVLFVTRTDTVGGAAPEGGCVPGSAGEVRRVPYEATYTFFSG